MSPHDPSLAYMGRIARATERIADALENTSQHQVTLKLDGRTLAQSVVKETLRTASRWGDRSNPS